MRFEIRLRSIGRVTFRKWLSGIWMLAVGGSIIGWSSVSLSFGALAVSLMALTLDLVRRLFSFFIVLRVVQAGGRHILCRLRKQPD